MNDDDAFVISDDQNIEPEQLPVPKKVILIPPTYKVEECTHDPVLLFISFLDTGIKIGPLQRAINSSKHPLINALKILVKFSDISESYFGLYAFVNTYSYAEWMPILMLVFISVIRHGSTRMSKFGAFVGFIIVNVTCAKIIIWLCSFLLGAIGF